LGEVTKVRGIFGYTDKPIKEIFPGEPGLVLGFEKMPAIGAKIGELKRDMLEVSASKQIQGVINKTVEEEAKLNLVLKAQTSGSLEALLSNIPASVGVILSGVGDIIDADIFAAKSAKNCYIFAFEVKVPSNVAKLAETEGVRIETFDIIYRLFERIDEILKAGEEEVLGKAEIIASFPYENKIIAGCRVVQGRIAKNDTLNLLRGEKMLGSVKAISLKKEKKEITEAKQGEEFGVMFHPQLDFSSGDVLVSVRK
jgi:translation initiation factor IF-2